MPLFLVVFVCLLRLRVDVEASGSFEEEGLHQDQEQYLDPFQGKLYIIPLIILNPSFQKVILIQSIAFTLSNYLNAFGFS